jgi:hypothetical protein
VLAEDLQFRPAAGGYGCGGVHRDVDRDIAISRRGGNTVGPVIEDDEGSAPFVIWLRVPVPANCLHGLGFDEPYHDLILQPDDVRVDHSPMMLSAFGAVTSAG